MIAINEPLNYCGIPIIVSPLLPMTVSKRRLVPKPWHRKTCYARRVDKKWLRQFGTEEVHAIMMNNAALSLYPGSRRGETMAVSAAMLGKLQAGK